MNNCLKYGNEDKFLELYIYIWISISTLGFDIVYNLVLDTPLLNLGTAKYI